MNLRGLLVLLLAGCAPSVAPPERAQGSAPASSAHVVAADASRSLPDASPAAPVARRDPKVTELHGLRLVDDYAWLRQKDSPEVLAYLNAENAYTDAVTRPTLPLQETLYREMLGRVKETDDTVPARDGGWLYYSRVEEGKPYRIYCRKKSEGAKEVVLVDLNEIGKTEKFVALGPVAVSDDGNQLAYSLDTTGYRQYELRIKDLRTGALAAERIPRVDGVAFARDNRTLYYVTEDATTKRSDTLHRHTLGQDPARDPVVFHEDDEKFDVWVRRSRSKEFVVATSESKLTTEVRVISAADPVATPRVVLPREHDHKYYVDHAGSLFYIRTNSGGRNYRLVSTPVGDTRREKWKDLVPHRADVMLDGVQIFADHMVLSEREDGLPHITIAPLSGAPRARLPKPEATYMVSLADNREFRTDKVRVHYESPVTPPTVTDYDVKSLEGKVRKRLAVPHYDAAAYDVARDHATAHDGTKVPVSLLFKRGTRPDGTHPLFLQAYGSYGYAYDADFSSAVLSLVDRGAVVAIAHVRGGGDLGKAWHDAGRMMEKKNTFTDFIDVAEHLVATGWGAKGRIGIEGGSAGGLLMGAVTNMRPDLWKAVIAHVPFVDVMNTMLDTSLPLTVSEFEEWGDPRKEAEGRYIASYSPYDNVTATAYPAILVRTSYNDSQVMYWEPAKYVARLRATKTDANPLLLRTNMDPAGHGGRSNRYEALRDTAFDYAFLITQLGVTP